MKSYFKDFIEGITHYHCLVFICCWLGGIFDGLDSTLMSAALPSALKDLVGKDDPQRMSLIGSWLQAVFLLGWAIGGFSLGIVADKLGRIKSMILSILFYAIFTGLASFAQTWEHLAICRFLTGLGIGGELVSITTFLAEVWPSKSRAIAIGILISSYQAGVLLAGGINYFLADWRTCFLIGALPAFLVIVLRMALKESEKWIEDQSALLQGKEEHSIMKILGLRENTFNLLLGVLLFGGLLIGYWASLSWIPTWIQVLVQNDQSQTERSLSLIYLGSFAIIGCCSAGFLVQRFGRKPIIIFSSGSCFVASQILFLSNPSFSEKIYWECGLLGYFIGLIQSSLYIYLPECFITRIRATATGICLNAGRIATVLAVLSFGSLGILFKGYHLASAFFAISYLIISLATMFAKETKCDKLPVSLKA